MMKMKKSKFINEGGIQGAGTGFVDTESPDWQAFLSVIKQHTENRSREERADTKLKEIRFRMGAYLRDVESKLPVDTPSLLNEAIGALGVKKKDFATYIGIEDSNLSAMLKGNRRISPEFALRLEQVFSISATLWLSVQIKNELKTLRFTRFKHIPVLSRNELIGKIGGVITTTPSKPKKHEPTRKTTGQ
jgi:addiction module HigA family antidote